MGKRVKIQTEYPVEKLHERYREAKNPVERTHWQILWLAREGHTPQRIADQLGYSARWVRTIIRRWNEQGEEGIRDRRREVQGSPMLLSAALQSELKAALQQPPADGGLWSGPKVAQWMQQRLGRPGGGPTRLGVSVPHGLQHPRTATSTCQNRRGPTTGF